MKILAKYWTIFNKFFDEKQFNHSFVNCTVIKTDRQLIDIDWIESRISAEFKSIVRQLSAHHFLK